VRDAKRIWPLLKALEQYWNTQPNTRLCELIVNLTGKRDPFDFEDEELMEAIQRSLELTPGAPSDERFHD
jgi:hypothetical protein